MDKKVIIITLRQIKKNEKKKVRLSLLIYITSTIFLENIRINFKRIL
jgi:hypothetical protein